GTPVSTVVVMSASVAVVEFTSFKSAGGPTGHLGPLSSLGLDGHVPKVSSTSEAVKGKREGNDRGGGVEYVNVAVARLSIHGQERREGGNAPHVSVGGARRGRRGGVCNARGASRAPPRGGEGGEGWNAPHVSVGGARTARGRPAM